MDALLRAVKASLRVAEAPEPATVDQAAPAPSKARLDPKNNVYVIGYSTKSWSDDNGGRHIELEYGPDMERAKYTGKVLTDVGFSNKGDNFKWARLYWIFTLDGKQVLFQTDLTPDGKQSSVNQSLAFNGGDVLVDGKLLSVSDLSHLPVKAGWPFMEGTKRFAVTSGGEFLLPGPVFLYDGSKDGDGKYSDPGTAMDTMTHLQKTAGGSVGSAHPKQLPGSNGKFVGNELNGNSYRIWDEAKGSLVKLNGTPDPISTKYVKGVLSSPDKGPQQDAAGPGGSGHIFEPQGETAKKHQQGEPPMQEKQAEDSLEAKDKGLDLKTKNKLQETNNELVERNTDLINQNPYLRNAQASSQRVLRAFLQ